MNWFWFDLPITFIVFYRLNNLQLHFKMKKTMHPPRCYWQPNYKCYITLYYMVSQNFIYEYIFLMYGYSHVDISIRYTLICETIMYSSEFEVKFRRGERWRNLELESWDTYWWRFSCRDSPNTCLGQWWLTSPSPRFAPA